MLAKTRLAEQTARGRDAKGTAAKEGIEGALSRPEVGEPSTFASSPVGSSGRSSTAICATTC